MGDVAVQWRSLVDHHSKISFPSTGRFRHAVGRLASHRCRDRALEDGGLLSKYRRPDKHFQNCVAALSEKPRRKLEPRVLYALFEANSQCILAPRGKCPLLVFTNQLCDAINEYMFEGE